MQKRRSITVVVFLITIITSSLINAQTAPGIHRVADDFFQLILPDTVTSHFAILQVTDQHFGKDGFWRFDMETCRRTARLVEMYHPHLIAITGDMLTGEKPCGDLLALFATQFFDDLKTPWLYVFGNHDPEGGMGNDRIYEIISASQWGMLGYHLQEDGKRKSDYIIEVSLPNSDAPAWEIFGFDSGSKKGEKSIKSQQLEWYKKASASSAKQYGRKIPAVAFFHIPLKDYQDMWDDPSIKKFGESKEPVSFEEDDGSVYQTFLQVGNIKACFCGHDHYNNFWGVHRGGILLGYGYISGEATKYAWPTGGKLIKLPLGVGEIVVKNVVPDSVMLRKGHH